jgi:SAM-dependent methyltransferase
MVFSSIAETVDYSNSIYEGPTAIGSGGTEHDRKRLAETAFHIVEHAMRRDARILDVGCARGGLLDALRDLGFTNLTGLDPSAVCAAETYRRGHKAVHGLLSDVGDKFDFITLSHVLEHIPDVHGFLFQILAHLESHGRVYIEVPDAELYDGFSDTLPFLDFNSEHINHFDFICLHDVLDRCGFNVVSSGHKNIALTNGSLYPAIWAVASRKPLSLNVKEYIRNSAKSLAKANAHINERLGATTDIAIWGAGEYLAHILALPAIFSRRIVQVVDRNPNLHGREVAGCIVEPPSCLLPGLPVVVAALVAAPAIRRDAEALGVANIITLEVK